MKIFVNKAVLVVIVVLAIIGAVYALYPENQNVSEIDMIEDTEKKSYTVGLTDGIGVNEPLP